MMKGESTVQVAPPIRVVVALLLGSGFAALVYQTAWQRMFRLTFGATTGASAAVLAIFLGGLGLGGALLGKRVERSKRPLVFYGNLELGISLVAALSPLFASAAHSVYLGLGGSRQLGTVGATLLRLALTAAVIGPAAILMGGTLPAVARAVVRDDDESRSRLALLYSLNTVGAVVGALAGPLLLFGLLGNQLTLWGAASLNALIGLLARSLGRALPELTVTQAASAATVSAATPSTTWQTRFIYLVAACVGFVFLALELVWYRVLAPILGGTSVTFGLILASALAGIGLGGWIFSRRAQRRPATLELLGATLALEAVCVLLPFAWGDDLAFVAAHLHHMSNLGFGYLLAGWLFLTAVVVLPASIVSGYQFSALFSLLGRGKAQVAEQVGRVYAFNTLGTLLGALLTGFVLLPGLGSVALWRWLALTLASLGILCALFAWHGSRAPKLLYGPLALALLAFALSGSRGPGVVFRHSPIGAGRLDVSSKTRNQLLEITHEVERDVVWERDGVESTIAIRDSTGFAFYVNGKSDGAVVADRGTQAFLGLLPAALHGSVKSAFVVGLGTGMSAGLLGRAPGVERVEVAELEPSVLEVARRARAANEAVLDNARVQIRYGDGRELLLTSPDRYDLIVSEPSNPYRAGVAALFTREFYAAAASRLTSQGLFAQWLQGYEIDARGLSIAMHTMRSVFPHVSLWSPDGADLILIGSLVPQTIDADRLRRDLAAPHYSNWMLRAWDMEGAEALIAHHLAAPRLLDKLAESLPAPVNTDDENVLEFELGRRLGDGRYRAVTDVLTTLASPEMRRPEVKGAVDWARVDDLTHRIDGSWRSGAPSRQTQAVVAGCGGDLRRASSIWPPAGEPKDLIEVWVLGLVEAERGEGAAELRAERLRSEGFVSESLLVRSKLAGARKDYGLAVDLLLQAFDELRVTALPLCSAVERALRHAEDLNRWAPERTFDLVRGLAKGPFAIHIDEGRRSLLQLLLGRKVKDPALCLLGLGSQRAKPVWQLEPLRARAACLALANATDAAAAQADLSSFLANEPVTFSPDQASSLNQPAPSQSAPSQ